MTDKNCKFDLLSKGKQREILLIRAKKPLKLKEETLPEQIFENLEADINKTAVDNKLDDRFQSNKNLDQRENTFLST